MRFNLIDQIVELIPGERIHAVKNLTLGEEYLADHFPTFPVMPGVLMLEALVQAGAWLLRVSSDFAQSVIVLREAKGVKYGSFVEPGRQLHLKIAKVEGNTQSGGFVTIKGNGEVDGVAAVSARFVLASYSLRDRDPSLAGLDEQLTHHYQAQYAVIKPRRSRTAAAGSKPCD
jgi:3-hydroxyacyl-[acyl-carrier-protein] dehydratase